MAGIFLSSRNLRSATSNGVRNRPLISLYHKLKRQESCSQRCLDYHFSRAPVHGSSTSAKPIVLRIDPKFCSGPPNIRFCPYFKLSVRQNYGKLACDFDIRDARLFLLYNSSLVLTAFLRIDSLHPAVQGVFSQQVLHRRGARCAAVATFLYPGGEMVR